MEPSELTHEYLDSTYESSVAHQLARYALDVDYDSVPNHVIHQAKRSLLDGLGCAIAAYEAPGFEAFEEVISERGGAEEATVFKSGEKTNAENAALANSVLVRFLDYNDTGGGGHNSDAIPSLLAISEREQATPEEFITALVVSYELGARVKEAAGGGGGVKSRGWTSDIRGGLSMPPSLGKLMGLTESQIANAIGCCASRNLPIRVLDPHTEELTMAKNLRFGSVAADAITCCRLAKNGFTGPKRVVEGDGGLNMEILGGSMDFAPLLDVSSWQIMDTNYKTICANHTQHGHLLATLSIVRENDLEPEDIESILIQPGSRTVKHNFNYAKKYPRNGETANHSGYYTTAFAIKEHDLGPKSHDPENFSDPVILELIDKITAEPAPDLPDRTRTGTSQITTTSGETYKKQKSPPGANGNDPVSDETLEEKFLDSASRYLDDSTAETMLDMVWNLEDLDDMSELTELMTVD